MTPRPRVAPPATPAPAPRVPPRVIVTGDSHTGPLARGFRWMLADDPLPDTVVFRVIPLGGGHLLPTPFWEDRGDHVALVEPAYAERIARLPIEGRHFDAVVLSMPLWPMRVLHTMIAQKLSYGPAVAGLTPVSTPLFHRLIMQDQRHVLGFAEALQTKGIHVGAVSPPFIFGDNKALKSCDRAMARHVFHGFRAFMMDQLAQRGIDIIDLPDDSWDDEGFMDMRWRHESPSDHHHGNRDFGAMMMRRVHAWAETLNAAPRQRRK